MQIVALLWVTAALPLAAGLGGKACTADGTYCTVQCGTTLYTCLGGTRLADQPVAPGTVCYDPGGGNAYVCKGLEHHLTLTTTHTSWVPPPCSQSLLGLSSAISAAPLRHKLVSCHSRSFCTCDSPPLLCRTRQQPAATRSPSASRRRKNHPFQTRARHPPRRRSRARRRARAVRHLRSLRSRPSSPSPLSRLARSTPVS